MNIKKFKSRKIVQMKRLNCKINKLNNIEKD